METAIQLSSAAATADGPLAGETGHGLLNFRDVCTFAVVAGADGAPTEGLAVKILSEALRIAFRPKDGSRPPASVEGKARLIRNAIRAAGEAIAQMPSEKCSGGATVAVLAFDEDDPSRASILNVGNCRCYRFRNGRTELLTRNETAEETATETPLLMNVTPQSVGIDEVVDINEQYVQVEPGDALLLLPGAQFKSKAEQTIGRALRRTSHESASAMAAALVEEAAKTENAEGSALVVDCEAVEVPATVTEAETGVEAGALAVTDDAEPDTGDTSGEMLPPMPSSEPQPDDTVVEHVGDEAADSGKGKTEKRSTRKIVVDESAGEISEPEKPEPKATKPAPVSAAPKSPLNLKTPSPLTRSPLLQTEDEPVKNSPWPIFAAITVAVIVVGGLVWLGTHLWHRHKLRANAEAELQQASNVTDLAVQARLTGKWSEVEKSLAKLPPLPPEEDAVTRAWIALWHQAASPELSDDAAHSRLTVLDMLVAQAGGSTTPSRPVWTAADRADVFCRLVSEKQQQLSASVEQLLQAMNKRSDIPFADRNTQEATLVGIGQFTRGRYARTLDSIRGAFATARISEGQLESWLNRRQMDLPQDEISLQRMPGEPLRQLSSGLDRAWDGLFEIAIGSDTDSAWWRKRASTSLQPRLNRLDAVRQNVIAERKRFGDIHRWRVSTQNKQLMIWLLNETASLGAQLGKVPAATPATPSRRR